MEHEQVKEIFARNGSGPLFSAFGMAIPEGDHAVLAVQDIFFPDDAPVVCPRCGKRTMDEVFLTELGQSQMTEATMDL